MRIAMFQGYHGGAGVLGQVAAPVLDYAPGYGYAGLTTDQLSMADDALAAAKRGRSFYEVWKPSITEIEAMRGWLTDDRVGLATFNVYLQKCKEAMGSVEWDSFLARWASTVNAAQQAYDTATDRPILPPEITAPVGALASAGKWVVVGLVAYALIRGMSFVPDRRR